MNKPSRKSMYILLTDNIHLQIFTNKFVKSSKNTESDIKTILTGHFESIWQEIKMGLRMKRSPRSYPPKQHLKISLTERHVNFLETYYKEKGTNKGELIRRLLDVYIASYHNNQ
jgi:hypothetical protein